jgi:Mn2+/Fe2+ NRAMP family transporter
MKSKFLQTLGPGILFASTAIGVSHLVQSTRAGADYGFLLLWAVILVNIMKYPFFEYGSRYANARGESIIEGYQRIGDWLLWLLLIITIGSMFFVTAAVGFVTSGFLDNLFGISSFIPFKLFTPLLLFAVCISILVAGKYRVLDGLIKVIATVLLVSTLTAFVIALINGPVERMPDFIPPDPWDDKGLLFLIALMGWMPTAVDMSAWNSLWTIERIKQTGYKPTLRETTREFNIGYWTSAALSICFITLGAFLVYGTGISMPNASHLFANQVVQLYTETIGQWSYFIIAAAAFSIMFGTSIAVFDGYARVFEKYVELLLMPRKQKGFDTKKMEFDAADFKPKEIRYAYTFALLIVGIGGFIIIAFFTKNLKQLVDLATTISFLISPLIAIVNFRLVSRKYLSAEHVPPRWMRVLSYLGIVFLTGFSIFFLVFII